MNAPRTFAAIWKGISGVLDANTAAKIFITTSNTSQKLLEIVAPEQLEARFGGSNPQKTSDFFPPSYPGEIFNSNYEVGISQS
jgi:hypothetical protein